MQRKLPKTAYSHGGLVVQDQNHKMSMRASDICSRKTVNTTEQHAASDILNYILNLGISKEMKKEILKKEKKETG